MKVLCYPRCGTCKKALKWLDDNGIEYEQIDIKADHPDEKTLRSLYKKSGLPLKRFFNTSGQLYRSMELSKKLPDMTEEEAKLASADVSVSSDATFYAEYQSIKDKLEERMSAWEEATIVLEEFENR